MLGRTVAGRYRVEGVLGAGGSATTFRARDARDDSTVALKISRPGAPAETRAAFEREFEQLRGVYHPRLATVHDFGLDRAAGEEPVVFIVSDLVEGETLSQRRRGRSWEDVAPAFCDALEALLFLHRLGVAHGDFKPDNILVDREGHGILIDLGCARTLGAPPSLSVSGTRGFVAPEILRAERADARADVFAAGITLRSLTEGPRLRALADRMTSEAPADRPSDVGEVLEALGRRVPAEGPPAGRAPRLVGRAREMAVIESLLDALCEGVDAPRVVFVHGPRGIGRSRLLREIEWTAQPRCRVVSAFGEERGQPVAALRRLLGDASIRAGAEGLLEARERIAALGEPCVLVIDDLDARSPEERALSTAWARSARLDERCLLVCAGVDGTELAVRTDAVRELPLEPLSVADVAEWAGPSLGESQIRRVCSASGGYPAAVEAVLASPASHRAASGPLSAAGWDARGLFAPLVSEADTAELRALALLAVEDGAVDDATAEDVGVDLSSPELRPHVLRAPGGWTLRRRIDALAILDVLGAGDRGARELRALASALADRLTDAREREPDRDARLALDARRLAHLVRAERMGEAFALVVALAEQADRVPAFVARALDDPRVGASLPADLEASLAASAILCGAGEPRRALSVLARLLRQRGPDPVIARARLEAAAAYLRLGDPRRAARALRKIPDELDVRPRRADLLSRSLVALGRAREAWDVALAGLPATATAEERARLHEDLGVAALYLGDGAQALHHLGAALEAAPSADARARIRLASYRGIASFRAGDAATAAAHYREALALAEANALDDQLATALLNVGTASQQAGELGDALSAYERGLRLAVAIGKRSTEVTLRYNVANLYAVIGLVDRAEGIGHEVETIARAEGMTRFEATCTRLRGELALLRGRPRDAERDFAAAAQAHDASGETREASEARVHLAAALRAQGELDRATELVAGVLRQSDAADVRARAMLESARLDGTRGRDAAALRTLEEALGLASTAGDRLLEAEIEAQTAACARSAGASELAASHEARARALLDRIAVTLPPEMRDAFERHPARAALGEHRGSPPGDGGRRELERILEINKRLGSSVGVDEVLEQALDAAIDLSGAERGFVLVPAAQGGALRAAVARNIDRERLGRSHSKFSRGIAERVMKSGEPIVTVDAQDDTRFRDNRSVHAMRLTSVACVPIRSTDGILGAIYVDNRFRRGRFDERDAWILLAFADQVAIALHNARQTAELEARTRELEARTRELEAERDRVRALMREQERDLDRLAAESRAHLRALAHRYDYSQIVGSSPPMQRLLALVDRVVEPSVDVLLEGESGTGKELVARAIHYNGPRAERPFVAVNCAALPESLLESELFGHVKGAFTGADRSSDGLFVAAHGGTIFLDEIGETSPATQAKLLRVLQERRVRPVGATDSVAVNVRVLSATNRKLDEDVAAGRFREDLFYRLAVVTLPLPPLRERTEDIPELAHRLLDKAAAARGGKAPTLGPDAVRALMAHTWPGNVRELENVLTRALLLCDGDVVRARHMDFPEPVRPPASDRRAHEAREADRIRATLEATHWNVTAASQKLGIPRNTLYRKMKRYGIR